MTHSQSIPWHACLSAAERADLEQPTETTSGLPARTYVDPEFYELERRTLFCNGWLAAAFEQDIPEPGDVYPVTIAGWELLFVRTSTGAIQCFHNVCRHRGMKLVREPMHAAERLACPWHCWTYDLDGKLVATPNLGGAGVSDVAGIDKRTLGLVAVRCERWWNFLFVNINGDAPPLAEHMAPLDQRSINFDRAELACSSQGLEFDYDGNWKILVEGGIEDYHFPWVHPQLMPQGLFEPEIGADCYAGISSKPATAGGQAKMVGKSLGPESRALPKFSHFADPDQVEMGVFMALPSAVIAFNQDHAVSTLFIPMAHDRTHARRLFHFVGAEATADAAYAEARDNVRNAWLAISEQDAEYVAAVHQMSHTRDALAMGTRFSPFWEPAVHHFQKIVARRTDSGIQSGIASETQGKVGA